LVSKKYHPTRDKIETIRRRCEKKSDNRICNGWKCSECRTSDAYERLTSIRLEEVDVDY